jgi:hypothetical protein
MSEPNPKDTTAREREPRPPWFDKGINRECDYEPEEEEC